jgi:hypothetical protein
MTLSEFAESIISDPEYRTSVVSRARAGTLAPDIELLLLELADGRLPIALERSGTTSPARALALVRPSVSPAEEAE